MLDLKIMVDKLLSIQREKYNGLLKILELTKHQHEALLDADIEKLSEFIELRQVEIDLLDSLDKEYSTLIENLKIDNKVESLKELEVFDSVKALELDGIIDAINKAMRELNSYEEENHRILEEQKKEFADRIKQINQGKRAEKMYQSKGYVQPVFYDKKTHY